MHLLNFTADLIDHTEHVRLTQPNGGHGGYHIYIDDYYRGQIVNTPEGWRAYSNKVNSLMRDDYDALIERVEMYEAMKG